MPLDLSSIGKRIGPLVKDYGWKDVVLYALGVGAGFDELDYCYERRLKVIPSFAAAAIFEFATRMGTVSCADLTGVVHGEQDTIFHSPIPVEGRLTTEGSITHVYDKGPDKGALVIGEADTFQSDGRKLCTNTFTLFCRKDGGFRGPAGPSEAVEFPARTPDFEERGFPAPNQPLLFRLSGDLFPLHIDPDFARAGGFNAPIMHGLCTHGFACRALIKHLFPGEPEGITRLRSRFSRPIYPGVPIRTQIWKIASGKALFRTMNAQNGDIIIDRGIVEWISSEERAPRQKSEIRFDGRVAVITGAGGGLGRAYALELAKRGARVVVNDVGGSRDGAGETSQSPADRVVEEIKKLGGDAVASYDSVATPEGGEAIIKTALGAFGRVDILINNAGILRDRTFANMQPEDWDAVCRVHQDGAYNVTRPAFLAMREQGYGRIIVTTSAAGLYGNFGQANYAAAKMALVGFMNTLRLEGEKYNIRINAIAPVAMTRMTADILPAQMAEPLRPEFVAPLVVYLCSEQCPVSAAIYNAGGGYFSRAAMVTGPSAVVGDGRKPPTPEEIHRGWAAINTLEPGTEYHSVMDALAAMMKGAG